MDVTTLLKVLGKKDMNRLPSDILRKLKKHFQNYNEQFTQLKELYNDADDNLGTYRLAECLSSLLTRLMKREYNPLLALFSSNSLHFTYIRPNWLNNEVVKSL